MSLVARRGDWVVDLDLSPDTTVSRRHARLIHIEETCWIEDISSRGGTWVNGERITVKTPLEQGDLVKIGRTDLKIFLHQLPPIDDAEVFDTQPIHIDQDVKAA